MFPGDKFLMHFDKLEMLHMAHICFTHIPSETCMFDAMATCICIYHVPDMHGAHMCSNVTCMSPQVRMESLLITKHPKFGNV